MNTDPKDDFNGEVASSNTGPFSILLVEDNSGDALIINELLEESGIDFSLSHVSSLKETLLISMEKEFDVILLDLGLPDSIGVETLKKLQLFRQISPVVVMTGLDDEDIALESLRQGAQDYLVKNRLSSDNIVRAIKYGIERKRIMELLKKSELRYRKLSKELETKVKERTRDLENLNYHLKQELVERHTAEEALKKSEARLLELNATKDKFFNIIAHDLKNPFTCMLGSTELLLEKSGKMNPEAITELAQVLNDSAKSGFAILQNLLDWSRSQTGMITLSPEPLNLKSLVDENIADVRLASARKEIDVISEIDGDLILSADKNMLNTILRNLISNAMKFTPRYGTVRIRAAKNQGEVSISVKDTGIGIPEENIGSLFRIDSNYTRPGTGLEQGTGLGLKLCREFAEMQGGNIRVRSKVKKGSEFIVTLPVKE